MSWTVEQTDKNSEEDMKRLQLALEAAAKKGMLLFCAAPDSGDLSKSQFAKYLPIGCSNIPGKFGIGAAMADGSAWRKTGSVNNIDFILPGHEVEERSNDLVALKKRSPKTGSSIATSLAAGLAANIIDCVRIGAIENYNRTGNASTAKWVQTIRGADKMRAVFSKMANERDGAKKYLDVWSTFDQVGKEMEGIDVQIKEMNEEMKESSGVDENKVKELETEIKSLEDRKLDIVKNIALKLVL